MILYNVTVSVDLEIEEEWVKWMKAHHIPDVMATGCFVDWKMFKVLLQKEDSVTYSIQYFSKDLKHLQQYHSQYAKGLQITHQEKYLEKVVAFRTVLEEIV